MKRRHLLTAAVGVAAISSSACIDVQTLGTMRGIITPLRLLQDERIRTLAQRHQVSIKAAALQFSLANPAVAAVIPGASKPERIAEDFAALSEKIPAAFWQEMREQQLVAADAPLPSTRTGA